VRHGPAERVLDLVAVHDAEPLRPRVAPRPLVEPVAEGLLQPPLLVLAGEFGGRARERHVAHDLGNLLPRQLRRVRNSVRLCVQVKVHVVVRVAILADEFTCICNQNKYKLIIS